MNILEISFGLFRAIMMVSVVIHSSILLFIFSFDITAGLEYKFVNVLFRHGDRTPEENPYELFPTSPYSTWNFHPYGYGQLTNRGKQRSYELGRYIREQYGEFLGNLYYPNVVIARSTDYDRTKMSLQLVMAGLFSPVAEQKWNPDLNWQPVIMNYVPRDEDILMFSILCLKFQEELRAILMLPEVQKEIGKFDDLQKNLTEWTGTSINNTRNFMSIYNSLTALRFMEIELPEWASEIFPDGMLSHAATINYRINNYNERLRSLNGGMILKNFTDNMLAVVNGDQQPELKMVLLSGHELNIAALLAILGVHELQVPKYSSAIFIELLKDDDKYYVRIYYYLGIPPERIPIKLSGCEEVCPFEIFRKIFSNALPTEKDMIC